MPDPSRISRLHFFRARNYRIAELKPSIGRISGGVGSGELPVRRLYLRAGDFHSAGRRVWGEPSRDRLVRGFDPCLEELECAEFECVEKRDGAAV